MWKHFLWEVIPEWWKGPGPAPKEDVFLLRAMEQPLYMSTDELYDVFEVRVRVKEGLEVKNTTTALPPAYELDVDGMKLHVDSFLDL
ncbi:hypothetical protein AN958_11126 [Leucoagaricus sp. SymC.cos]|nr:hypothetical protein AN958_11126 [Leucoagaricus sp. SymC.cos]